MTTKTSLSSYPSTNTMHELKCNNCGGRWHCTCGSMKLHQDSPDLNQCPKCLSRFTSPDPLCHVCGRQFCQHKGNLVKLNEKPWSKQNPEEWEKTRRFLMELTKP